VKWHKCVSGATFSSTNDLGRKETLAFTFWGDDWTIKPMATPLDSGPQDSTTLVSIYYDGLCQLCSREMDHYRNQQGSERFRFVDICAPGFDAAAEGVDPVQVHQVMHVRRRDGTLATRVDAFIEIWNELPKYRWVGYWARKPIFKILLECGYTIFAWIRPMLPRKSANADCIDSPYCEHNQENKKNK
jgi:predicted DCC family thiol-disulfide oxidoreductase YuxK